jgi:hypothetical protein
MRVRHVEEVGSRIPAAKEEGMEGASPARLYCLLVGAVLVVAGIIGFFYESSFDVGDEIVSEDVFDVLAVNGWHNVVHLGIGIVLLVAAGRLARGGALTVGALYIALAALGFVATSDSGIDFVAENNVLIDLVPVNDEDNLLHLILGATGLLAGFATRGRRAAPAT